MASSLRISIFPPRSYKWGRFVRSKHVFLFRAGSHFFTALIKHNPNRTAPVTHSIVASFFAWNSLEIEAARGLSTISFAQENMAASFLSGFHVRRRQGGISFQGVMQAKPLCWSLPLFEAKFKSAFCERGCGMCEAEIALWRRKRRVDEGKMGSCEWKRLMEDQREICICAVWFLLCAHFCVLRYPRLVRAEIRNLVFWTILYAEW